jgi:uncharacterized membrane protein
VVAIAATLLILPVIEKLSDASSAGGNLSDLLTHSTLNQIVAFFLTFWVMTVYWQIHHQAFELLKDYSPGLITLTFLWLIFIIFLALPSGYLDDPDGYLLTLYFGTLGMISLLGTAIQFYASRHPELQIEPSDDSNKVSYWPLLFTALWLVAALAAQVPAIDTMALWAFVGLPFIRIIVARKGPPKPKHTERGFDRLVNFSDAVVAIAITLLILPLIDLVTDDKGDGSHFDFELSTFIKVISFVLTFWMMSRMWLGNHQTFEQIKDYSKALMSLTIVWLALMVFLAFPSGMLAIPQEKPDQDDLSFLAPTLFWGTMTLIGVFGALIQIYASRHKNLLIYPATTISPRRLLYLAVLYLAMSLTALSMGLLGFLSVEPFVPCALILLPFAKRLADRQDSAKIPLNPSP